jgi:Fe-S cluster biogenesis protein NfuA
VLGPGRTWSREGARVRTALHAALADREGWAPAADARSGDARSGDARSGDVGDEALRAAARLLIDGDLGRFAASHGGAVELIDVREGVVTVRLDGACHGCPAAHHTLGRRLEDELRRRCPHLRGVVAAEPENRPLLPLLFTTHGRVR